MGILDRKSSTTDESLGAAVLPPAPPAPPTVLQRATGRPATDAAIVSDAAERLAKRAAALTGTLRDRLAPFMGSGAPDGPVHVAPELASEYFNGVNLNLDDISASLDEIDGMLARLAI